ncbi:hypothetical protein QYF36_018965 [Acer negundo]|nr:hypothetical protein QYF36_018965 [Acer negundo]
MEKHQRIWIQFSHYIQSGISVRTWLREIAVDFGRLRDFDFVPKSDELDLIDACMWNSDTRINEGFQFIVDDSGGFSARLLNFWRILADEYKNNPVLLYAVRGPGSHKSLRSRKQTVFKELHDAISFYDRIQKKYLM